MIRHAGTLWLLLMAIVAGCAGSQFGDEGSGCEERGREPLEPTETSPGGFSARELIDEHFVTHDARIRWADGQRSNGTFSFDYLGGELFYRRKGTPTSSKDVPGSFCPDEVVIQALAKVTTEDASLSATLETFVAASSLDGFHADFEFEQTTLRDDVENLLDKKDSEKLSRIYLRAEVGTDGIHGPLTAQLTSSDGPVEQLRVVDLASIEPLSAR